MSKIDGSRSDIDGGVGFASAPRAGGLTPYYTDDLVTLYKGDCREVLPALVIRADCILADPPYESTSLDWDTWPAGWLETVAQVADSMWCWLPVRQFAMPPFRGIEFAAAGWTLSQDVIWEKHTGTGFVTDRFKRVHEYVLHWYRGPWSSIYHQTPRTPSNRPNRGRAVLQRERPAHTGAIGSHTWEDDGTRQATSVLFANSMRGRAIHPTEKPVGVLVPLIEYACPPGGLVIDPTAGSGSTGEAARLTGRRCVLIEGREVYCEQIANRLSQGVLQLEVSLMAATAVGTAGGGQPNASDLPGVDHV